MVSNHRTFVGPSKMIRGCVRPGFRVYVRYSIIFILHPFYDYQLLNKFIVLSRKNASGNSTPSGARTPRKGSADPTISSTMRSQMQRGTTPVSKREPFRL